MEVREIEAGQMGLVDDFFGVSLDLLCVADFDGNFIRLNPAWERCLGYRIQEMEGAPFLEFVHPDDQTATAAAAVRLAEGEEIIGLENRYRAKDGSYRWLSWNAAPKQSTRRVFAVARDITDKKMLVDQLEEQESRLAELYMLAGEGGLESGAMIEKALVAALDSLSMDLGIVSHVYGANYEILYCVDPSGQLKVGTKLDFNETYCAITLDSEEIIAINHMKVSDYAGHPCYQTFEMESYIGVPVYVNGAILGTLNFTSAATRSRPFTPFDRYYVQLLAIWIGGRIEHDMYVTSYRKLYDETPAMMHSIDLHGNLTSVSNHWLANMGYKRDQVIGRNANDFLTELSRQHLGESAGSNVFEQGFNKEVPCQFIRKDGSIMDTLLSAVRERDSAGNTLGTLAVLIDVTERNRMTRQFENIFNAMPDAVVFADPERRIVLGNPSFKAIFGYHPEDVYGEQTAVLYADKAEYERTGKLRYHAGAADIYHPYEVLYRRENGETFIGETVTTLVRDQLGRTTGYVAIIRDISERKQIETALYESQKRFEMAVDGARDGIWDWMDVNKEEQWWSPRFFDLLGYENEEIEPSLASFSMLLHPDDQSQTFAAVAEYCEKDIPFDVEYRLKTKSGEYKWFRARAAADRDESCRVTRMIGSISEIHEVKLARESLTLRSKELAASNSKLLVSTLELAESNSELKRQSKMLERSNSELEQFAYIASHDLQEPLRTVSNFLQLLKKRYKDQLDNTAIEFIDFAVDGSKRMTELINGLLEFSRLGRQQITPVPIECNRLVKKVCESLSVQISELNGQISYDNLPLINGDSAQLFSVFQNLLSNGLKFNRTGQPLITISVTQKKKVWRFCVADNGIGIEDRYKDKIFLIFQRLHARNAFPGQGVGLTICKKIIENHGGTIRLESTPGKGSKFIFTIPKTGNDAVVGKRLPE